MRRLVLLSVAALGLMTSACAFTPSPPVASKLAIYPAKTSTQLALNDLPPPTAPVAVAVYGFTDQTGQFKLADTGQNLSRAVTQGGGSILIKALQDAGNRKWFTVVEREDFKDLLNERQVIHEMRERYLGEKGVNPQALPALLFAGVILEGGIISYDTNTQTGGAGAAMLGIGLNATWRQDTVTVYLRAVSVKTGEVLTSVTSSKTITSYALSSNIFGYVDTDKILENEIGFTTNEPNQLALQQAIEKAVYGVVMEGVDLKLWNFQNPTAGWPYLWRYNQERDGHMTAAQVQAALDLDRRARAAAAHGVRTAGATGNPNAPAAPGQAQAQPQSNPLNQRADGARPATISSAQPARGSTPVQIQATPQQGNASNGG